MQIGFSILERQKCNQYREMINFFCLFSLWFIKTSFIDCNQIEVVGLEFSRCTYEVADHDNYTYLLEVNGVEFNSTTDNSEEEILRKYFCYSG